MQLEIQLKFSKFMAKPIHVLNTFLTLFSMPLMSLTGVVEKD